MALYVAKTATGLVTEALSLLEVVDETVALPDALLEIASRQLGMFLQSIQAEGATLWMRDRLTVDLIEGESEYILSDNSITALDVVQVTVSTDEDGTDELPASIISRRDYMDRTDKTSTGRPVQIWFHSDEDDGPTVTTWPVPDDSYVLNVDYRKPYAGITDSTVDVEVPDYWVEAIVYGLAQRCGINFGKAGTPRYAEIKEMARDLRNTASAFDITMDGEGEIRFAPGP